MELALVVIIVVGLILWSFLLRKRSHRIGRPRIYNQKCPQCGSDRLYYAGYADRKECSKCGKIF